MNEEKDPSSPRPRRNSEIYIRHFEPLDEEEKSILKKVPLKKSKTELKLNKKNHKFKMAYGNDRFIDFQKILTLPEEKSIYE